MEYPCRVFLSSIGKRGLGGGFVKTLLSLDIALILKSAVSSYEVGSQVRWVDVMSCKIGFVSEIYKIWYPTRIRDTHLPSLLCREFPMQTPAIAKNRYMQRLNRQPRAYPKRQSPS